MPENQGKIEITFLNDSSSTGIVTSKKLHEIIKFYVLKHK